MRIASIVLAILLSIGSLAAQEASTLQVSNRVIAYKVTMPDGTWIGNQSPEGSMLRVTQGNITWAFTPVIDATNNTVHVTAFEITTVSPGNERMKEIDAVDAEVGVDPPVASGNRFAAKSSAPIAFGMKTGIQVQVLGISADETVRGVLAGADERERAIRGEGTRPPHVKAPLGCCLTCGNTTACGCAVWMSCGECCAGTCCKV